MADEVIVREATKADWLNIAALLTRADLPLAGAEDHLCGFVVAVRGEEVLGCAGLERYGATGLLRSVAIEAAERGLGLGARLVGRILQQAEAQGIDQVVLLTETARDYFPRFSFRTIARNGAPAPTLASLEFTTLCPESATVMLWTRPGDGRP